MKFLTIARLLHDKGYTELIDASRKVHTVHPDVVFQWLGGTDDSYPEYIRRERVDADHAAGYIQYLGFASDVKPFIRDADCIILPSHHEGLSRTLMEALALSKPIITTDVPGCKETVDHGINGLLCKPHDANSLAQAILEFISLSPEKIADMGRESRRKAELVFDIRHVIPVYRQILEKRVGKS